MTEQPTQVPAPHVFDDLIHCARCGADHPHLEWHAFRKPVVDADGTVWRRWATCPTTGDPVLALFSDDIPSDETT